VELPQGKSALRSIDTLPVFGSMLSIEPTIVHSVFPFRFTKT
jgi:hypothetical protein